MKASDASNAANAVGAANGAMPATNEAMPVANTANVASEGAPAANAVNIAPSIAYTSRLREYMQKKGKPHVVVGTCSAKTCGGPLAELSISLADDALLEELRPEACVAFQTEVGSVLIMARGLEVSRNVTFGLRSFLGAKDVTVEGIRAFRF